MHKGLRKALANAYQNLKTNGQRTPQKFNPISLLMWLVMGTSTKHVDKWGVIHKPCVQLRGRGIAKCPYYYINLINKNFPQRGRGIKNVHIVYYEWPLKVQLAILKWKICASIEFILNKTCIKFYILFVNCELKQ